MKKAIGWTLLLTGAACLIFLFGVFVGRITIYTPTQPNSGQSASDSTYSRAEDHKININKADSQQLQLLPGIGETLAERIIEYRDENGPFSSFQELQEVEGLGYKTLVEIIEHICLEDK